jgi:GxxExxY protein
MRIDLLIEDKVVVELKSVGELLPIHEAQLLTYLKISGCRVGLLINFNTTRLTNSFRRFVL